jgi:hypothetical protein
MVVFIIFIGVDFAGGSGLRRAFCQTESCESSLILAQLTVGNDTPTMVQLVGVNSAGTVPQELV